MTAAKALEHRITRQLLQRSEVASTSLEAAWADRLIAVLAVTVALFMIGSVLEELLWVAVAAATVFALGCRD